MFGENRLHADSSGGAWCPAKTVSRDTPPEWIEVDFGEKMHVVTSALTQGRFGNGRGQEFAEAFKIQYWRPGMTNFKDYQDHRGRKVSADQIYRSDGARLHFVPDPF